MNVHERGAIRLAKQCSHRWERKCGVRVTVEYPMVSVDFPDGETLRFRWSPAIDGVEWLTPDLQGLDREPGWIVRAKALTRNGQGQGDG